MESLMFAFPVYKCDEFSKFNVFKSNRYCGFDDNLFTPDQHKQFETRVNKMIRLIQKNGLDMNQPIWVVKINGVNIIIDGQTRFAACKALNIPFYYSVLPVKDEIAAYNIFYAMNNYSSPWTATDKVISNMFNPNLTDEQRAEHALIVQMSKTYNVSISALRTLAYGGNGHKRSQLANTDLKMRQDTTRILEYCLQVSKHSDLGTSLMRKEKFVRAVARLFRHPLVTDELLNKVLTFDFVFGDGKATEKEFLLLLQNAINYKLHVRFDFINKSKAKKAN